jgi:hypothetical protein
MGQPAGRVPVPPVAGLIGRCGGTLTGAKLIAMTTPNLNARTEQPTTRVPMRGVRALAGAYLAVSVGTLAAIALLRHDAAAVNSAVWIRGVAVAASALLTTLFAARAAAGSRRAYLRLRIVSVVMVVAIVVIIALPGSFPLWLKIEQGVCGLLLLGMLSRLGPNRGRRTL